MTVPSEVDPGTPFDVEPGFEISGQATGIRLPPGVEPLPDPRNPGST